MVVYKHISTDLKHNGVFKPRIPSCRHQDHEDAVIPRISVAPSIEDCLTAIPDGGMNLERLNLERRGLYLLMTIDTEKLGITENDIITSETLYQKDLVRDADITNEVWITKEFRVPKEDMQIIKVTDWDEVAHDVIPHSIIEIADKKYEGDYLTAYQDIYEDYVPCSVGIENVKYYSESIKEGESVPFYIDNEIEKDAVLSYIDDIEELEIIEECTDEITVRAIQDVNLRRLYFYHADIAGLFI